MSQQHTFASAAYSTKGKVTRWERFLAEMNAVIPWTELLAPIARDYPKAERGRQPLPMAVWLRGYFLQECLRDYTVSDETTILRFRHLQEQHQLTQQMFAVVRELLETRRLLLKAGTIVDATIIATPSSTKNATQTREPEMRQTKKGNIWHFGMKGHVGTDRRRIVHTVTTTDAAHADITQMHDLLHSAETAICGDKGRLLRRGPAERFPSGW